MKHLAGLALALMAYGYAARAQPADTLHAIPLSHINFVDARAIAVDPLGALYVADAGAHVVIKMSATGARIATIGGPGSREGEFDEPADVDPTNGLVLLVADSGNNRIQLFSRSLAFLGSIPLTRAGEESASGVTYRKGDGTGRPAASGVPVAVASSGSNEIFAVDADRGVVLKWNQNRQPSGVIGDLGAGRGTLGNPSALWIGSRSLLYVVDRAAGAVLVYDLFGSYVRTLGSGMRLDIQAIAGYRSEIYVVLAREIRVYNEAGRFLRSVPIAIPEDVVDLAVTPEGKVFAVSSSRVYRLE